MKFFEVEGLSKKALSFLFIIKFFSGIAVWWVYTYYYTDRTSNDIFKFYDDGFQMFKAIHHNPLHYLQMVLGINTDAPHLVTYYKHMANWYKPWAGATYHNNRIIIQFNALVHLFSFGCYHVHILFMCFISFIGLTGIYKTFVPILINKTKELAIAVFMIPTVLFWGSGVLKEGIILFSLGLLLYSFYQFLFVKISLTGFIWIVFSTLILALTKAYVLVAILPSFLTLIWLKRTGYNRILLKFIGIHLLILIIGVNMYRINKKWDMLEALRYKQYAFTAIAKQNKAGSLITIKKLQSNTLTFIKNSPEAIFNTLFQATYF